MGNKLLTQYDVQKETCWYSAELKWRLHGASFKDKPDDKLTIFIFEKKVVEKYAKNAKENILETLRKDATNLQRLKHPHILSVVEALNEERSTLVFATKPVVGTVAQLLENNRHELSPLEMKCGLLDVAEALQFLHEGAKTAHLNISPHSIFIDPQGRWLLGGLGHSMSGLQWGQVVDSPYPMATDTPPGQLSAEPVPRYSAPEMFQMPAKCGMESDIFSMGLLTYELMSSDRQPLLRTAPRGYSESLLRASSVPPDLAPTLAKVLSGSPSTRLTIAGFINSEFFMDVNVRAIRFLEQLNEKEEAQRVTFLRGLPKLLTDPKSPLCSQRVLRERVLPRLCAATLFPSLYGMVVPNIISILKREKVTDPAHFQAKLWPILKPLFSAKEIPIEVVILFLKELDVLVQLSSNEETQAVLLPFVLRCLELQEPTILNEVLEKVPYLHKKFEYRQVKDQILPRMLQLMASTSMVKVKVQVLMGLTKILEIFDKNTIIDSLLPAFQQLAKTDRTPAVCMCLLGCLDAMSKQLGHKITAEKIIPLIVPMLVEESLTSEQFETQLSVCKKLLQRVESQRKKEYATKSDQIAEAGNALGGKEAGASPTGPAAPKEAVPETFESLLMGSAAKPASTPAPAPAATAAALVPPPASQQQVAAPVGDLLGGLSAGGNSSANPLGGLNFDPFSGTSGTAAAAPPPMNPLFAGTTPGSMPGGYPGMNQPAAGNPGGGMNPAPFTPFGAPPAAGANPGLTQPAALGGLAGLGGAFGQSPQPGPGFAPQGLAPQGPGGMQPTPQLGGNQALARNTAYDPFAEIGK
mmetsp:Transcript_56429/g.104457  ORF Transcript_56429/g.104457 Transcript_56429/m.104457 type:complete len:808 (+) Transcript_56429:143-2566(+)